MQISWTPGAQIDGLKIAKLCVPIAKVLAGTTEMSADEFDKDVSIYIYTPTREPAYSIIM